MRTGDWRPGATSQVLVERARLLRRIRAFLDERGLIEVQTPVITIAGITDVHIDSLSLNDAMGYLRTSPEYAHKRLLASGMGDLYELGPVFRAGESGRLHRIEFTLLEWYRLDWAWKALADEVLALIQTGLEGAGHPPWSTHYLDWTESFLDHDLPDPLEVGEEELRALSPELPEDCDRDMRLDWLFATRIQAAFPPRRLTVIHGYPASQAALARLDPLDPRKAERFEVFAGSIELANGYHELCEPDEQRKRFEADNARRRRLGRPTMPVDEAFLAALTHGLPDCSGVALGIDRLVMVTLGLADIADARAF
ncbi:EF-P lysine aminoacylase EpmA [Wenzhouxiangella marina]|uniref:Lysyl-tRNA synthetase n=1 Tax=Wenzhouxiangella marina TaxID=1579979 RepID=A0A0K0XXH4_9GAMM|nr:EF-P lysine aminoacylase EpmA [Wenzhouxiangella marina]AKS42399.1 lysyl-tRNA synthetase [Wenzhouxiangella marina]MBB6085827.1 lysyl-tRNA synthetase class 2 [Wenzhouxiangella marina]